MQDRYCVVDHWLGDFESQAMQSWAKNLRKRLQASAVSLGLIFLSPRFFDQAVQIIDLLRVYAEIPLLVGCSSTTLISNGLELEENPGVVLALYSLPGAELHPVYFSPAQVEESNGPGYWHSETEVDSQELGGWLVFADPFHMDCDAWLQSWNRAYSPHPILGGLASGNPNAMRTQLYLNSSVFEEGGVAVAVKGAVSLASIISQGCTPIGETWTITKTEQNVIREIANKPAYQVLLETYSQLSAEEQKRARGNLFVGLVVNEYLEEFHRGDFLVRNLLGADPKSGCIAVGAIPRAGQTIQFQMRDAQAATDDMTALLEQACVRLTGKTLYGGCLCSCNGRGIGLFGRPNHDAALVQSFLGPLGLSGFFCNGEIGPIADRSFLHGYTASLTLFVSK